MKTRKSNRAKRVSSGCRNNGSCAHCISARTHANRRAEPSDSQEQMRNMTDVQRGDRVMIVAVVLGVDGDRARVLLPAPETLGVPTIVGALEGVVPLESLARYTGTT